MSKKIFIANWKMNPQSSKEAQSLFSKIEKRANVILCPPFVYLSLYKKSSTKLGAQDCFWENKGAFTGEISPTQLKSFGCTHVILGHSERKRELGETLEMINKKVLAVLNAKMTPILCVGEKRRGETKGVMLELKAVLKGISKKDEAKIIVVYEPEWAISSNKGSKAAKPSDAVLVISKIKKVLKNTKVIYGGSVNSRNVAGFTREPLIDGVLVGAASLNAKEFVRLVNNGA